MPNNYYDFSEEELWLTRFTPINDAIRTVEQHLADTIASLDGVSLSYIDAFLARHEKQGLGVLHDLKRMIKQQLQAFEFVQGTPLEDVSIYIDEAITDENVGKGVALFSELAGSAAQEVGHFINPDLSNSESIEDAHDLDFELIQLINLGTFSRSLHRFVEGTLYESAKSALAAPDRHAVTWLVRACFKRLFTDIQIIDRAITQRSWQLTPDGKKQMGPQARALLVADKLAMIALAPAREMLPYQSAEHPILPITFFSQDTYIHHTPYRDDLLLIGMSFDHIMLGINEADAQRAHPAFELMAIPHEVGHYVYKHGRLHGQPIEQITAQIFADYPQLLSWREEIFADAYSCVVAGSLSVLGLQALIASSENGNICANDGEHPTGEIRPFILTQILSQLHNELGDRYPNQNVSAQLAENWQRYLEIRDIHPSGNIPFEPIAELLHLLIRELNLEPSGQFPLPWSNAFHENIKTYDQEMAHLIQAVFSIKEMPNHKLVDEADQSQGLTLSQILAKWDDDWDTGKGSSKGTLGQPTPDQEPNTNQTNTNQKKDRKS